MAYYLLHIPKPIFFHSIIPRNHVKILRIDLGYKFFLRTISVSHNKTQKLSIHIFRTTKASSGEHSQYSSKLCEIYTSTVYCVLLWNEYQVYPEKSFICNVSPSTIIHFNQINFYIPNSSWDILWKVYCGFGLIKNVCKNYVFIYLVNFANYVNWEYSSIYMSLA